MMSHFFRSFRGMKKNCISVVNDHEILFKLFVDGIIVVSFMASSSPLTKELWTELTKIKLFTRDQNLSNGKFFYEDSFFYAAGEGLPNRNVIIGRLWPTSDIYKDYALQIEIHLPSTYPGDPPEVKLDKVIYHPNVDDKGD